MILLFFEVMGIIIVTIVCAVCFNPFVLFVAIIGKIYLKVSEKLKQWLKKDFEWNNHKKYRMYFDEWYSNLTENQLLYYESYSKGQKTPFQGEKITE